MSKLKQTARHAESTKSSSSFAHRTATVAVAGGLIAGVGSASSAVAAEQTPHQVALTAATTPLELQAVTPAKSLVVKVETAKKTTPKVSRSSARKALTTADTQRTKQLAEARAAKAAQRAEARRAARLAKAKRLEAQRVAAEQRVSRAKARKALSEKAAAAQQQRTKHRVKPHVKKAVTTTTPTRASEGRSMFGAVNIAAGLTGIPYVYGGSSLSGIDCSGFVAMVYGKLGIALPHQSDAIRAMTRPTSDPQPGDLVFLPGHVAIYAGNGMVYEARHPGTVTGMYPLLDGSTFGRLR